MCNSRFPRIVRFQPQGGGSCLLHRSDPPATQSSSASLCCHRSSSRRFCSPAPRRRYPRPLRIPFANQSQSETYSTVSIEFQDTPSLNTPVTVTVRVVPKIPLNDASVIFNVVPGFDILGGSPGGYSTGDGLIQWDIGTLNPFTTYEYEASIEATDAVIGWLRADVFTDLEEADEFRMGVAGLAVRVNDGGSATSETGSGVIPITAPEQDPYLRYDEPLTVQMTWDEYPAPGETSTATAIITNTSVTSQSYNGSFTVPSGWSVSNTSTSWQTTLGRGNTETKTFVVQAGTAWVPWEVELYLDISDSSNPDYRIADIGAFREEGRSLYEGQARERIESSGSIPSSHSPLAHKPSTQDTHRVRGLAAPVRSVPAHPGSPPYNPCSFDQAYLYGGVGIGSEAVRELRVQLDWRITSSSSGATKVRGTKLMRLDENGYYNACIPVAGDPKVFMTIWSTDALGADFDYLWSVKVTQIGSPDRLFSDVMPGPTLGSPTLVHHDFDVKTHSRDPFPYRVASSYAHFTRLFLAENPSPAVTMRKTGHAQQAWQADVRLYSGNGGHIDGRITLDTRVQRSLFEAMSGGNHEYGHYAQWLLQGKYAGCGAGCGPWVEGWADFFTASVWSYFMEGGAGDGKGAGYGGPLEVLESAQPPFRRLPDAKENITAVGAGLWDMWDPIATEQHPGLVYEPLPPAPTSTTAPGRPPPTVVPSPTPVPTRVSHTFSDLVPKEFEDIWEVVDSMNIYSSCDFYAQWGVQGRPLPTRVKDALDHSGWDVCAGTTPVATQTPGPSQTFTPTPTRTPTPTP